MFFVVLIVHNKLLIKFVNSSVWEGKVEEIVMGDGRRVEVL